LTNFDPLAKQVDETGAYRLFLGFAGIAEDVAYQRMRIREFVEDGNPVVEEPREEHRQSLAEKLRDFPVVGDAALCCKASVLPTQLAGACADLTEEVALRGVTTQLMAHAGTGIIYTRVPRSDEVSPEQLLSLVDWLRVAAKKLSGYVIVEAIDSNLKERIDVWGHLGGAFPLMKKLKDTLDPHGILNPGRFVGGI
jgi:FAD/FMN-containing dehydrogenase